MKTNTKKPIRIVAVSDTHGFNQPLPQGDIYIHCGDFCNSGSISDVTNFCTYLSSLKFKHKIVVGGNHQLSLDVLYSQNSQFNTLQQCYQLRQMIKKNCIYLEHESIEVEGIKIFGSPFTFKSSDGAYRYQKSQAKDLWMIKESVDVLVTHGPPYQILDKSKGKHVGCQELRKSVMRLKPKHHFFGHIHSSYGHEKIDGTHFYNCSQVDSSYNYGNRPHVVDYFFQQ